MKVEGACHCGQVSYEAEVDPETVLLCNCTDCQVLTGSAFRLSVPAPSWSFRLLSGTPSTYVKTADSGTRRAHSFCPNCGAPVFACAADGVPPTYSLRVGGRSNGMPSHPRYVHGVSRPCNGRKTSARFPANPGNSSCLRRLTLRFTGALQGLRPLPRQGELKR